MNNDDVLIELDNVSKDFMSHGREIKVLRNVNITIKRNAFTIIFGPSGSGKSTLLNIIFGLEKPTSGKVTIGGLDVYSMSTQERAFFRAQYMGMVAQSNYWIQSLNVLENVAVPKLILGGRHKESIEAAKKSLAELHMDRFAQESPGSLSGGEQQRVSLARALISDPLILLADEPTGNLDTTNGDIIMDFLANYRSKNRTVILATHNLQYLVLSDEQIYVKDGIVVQTRGDYKESAVTLIKMWQDLEKKMQNSNVVEVKNEWQ